MNAAGIARQLGATPQGHNWRVPCPCECGYALSFCDAPDGRLLAYCFGGCDFSAILAELVQHGLLDDEDLDTPPPADRAALGHDEERRRRKIEQARAIYANGILDERIGVYLRSRSIGLTSNLAAPLPAA
jgi:hypothetical protein